MTLTVPPRRPGRGNCRHHGHRSSGENSGIGIASRQHPRSSGPALAARRGAAAIGLGAALEWMQTLDWAAIQLHELRLTRRLLDGLMAIPGARILGPADLKDRRGVVSFVIPRFSAEQICRHLNAHGVALRGGHHCAQPLVHAMGVDGVARASLALYSLDHDVDALLNGLSELVAGKLRLAEG